MSGNVKGNAANRAILKGVAVRPTVSSQAHDVVNTLPGTSGRHVVNSVRSDHLHLSRPLSDARSKPPSIDIGIAMRQGVEP